jgi:hypothetical protein
MLRPFFGGLVGSEKFLRRRFNFFTGVNAVSNARDHAVDAPALGPTVSDDAVEPV